MARNYDLAVDELSSSLKAGMALSSMPELPDGESKRDSRKGKVTAPSETRGAVKGGTVEVHDRWTLADESTIDYGYLAKTGGSGPEDKSFYITTAINYTNGPAHMGHAYEGTTSDVIARFARLCGDQSVYFVTGSDEHGQKIATTAQEADTEPIDLCNKVSCAILKLGQVFCLCSGYLNAGYSSTHDIQSCKI